MLNIADCLETHVITANGEDILHVTYFTDETCFHFYPITSTTKTAAFVYRLILMRAKIRH
jgi:hypothetical protein